MASSDSLSLPILFLSDRARALGGPAYGSAGAAGLDLRACLPEDDVSLTLAPGARVLVPTGLAVAVPEGHYGRVAPRSGLALKQGVDVLAGVIDGDYRGEVGVLVLNTGDAPVVVCHGDRIAQLIVERISRPRPVAVDRLEDSARGAGGFGSTGVGGTTG